VADLTGFARRLVALPWRARLALVAAVVLAVVAVLLVVLPGRGGGDDAAGDGSPGADLTLPSTTLNTGDIDVAAPDGWQPVPVPALGFGVAVPPGWEAAVLSAEGLAALGGAAPAVPGFADNAHAAAEAGGLVYAAGEDAAGGVSDLLVQAAPETGVTDAEGLAAYAEEIAADAGLADPRVAVVEGADRPTVRTDFRVGTDAEAAEATRTLVLGPDDLVWSLEVTSDDPGIHDDLVDALTATLTFPAG